VRIFSGYLRLENVLEALIDEILKEGKIFNDFYFSVPVQKNLSEFIFVLEILFYHNLFILSFPMCHPQTDAVKNRYSKYFSLYVCENCLHVPRSLKNFIDNVERYISDRNMDTSWLFHTLIQSY